MWSFLVCWIFGPLILKDTKWYPRNSRQLCSKESRSCTFPRLIGKICLRLGLRQNHLWYFDQHNLYHVFLLYIKIACKKMFVNKKPWLPQLAMQKIWSFSSQKWSPKPSTPHPQNSCLARNFHAEMETTFCPIQRVKVVGSGPIRLSMALMWSCTYCCSGLHLGFLESRGSMGKAQATLWKKPKRNQDEPNRTLAVRWKSPPKKWSFCFGIFWVVCLWQVRFL